jgi:hypothetical protein
MKFLKSQETVSVGSDPPARAQDLGKSIAL